MKKTSLTKRIMSMLLALTLAVTSLLAVTMVAKAVDGPTTLESTAVNFWADPENSLTQEDIDAFTAGTKTSMTGAVGVFKRSSSSSNYYLFLPSNADCNNLKIWFDGTASVTADGVTTDLVSGQATNAFSAVDAGGVQKTYTLNLGSSSYTVTAIKSGDVAAMYIDTTSGSMKTVNSSSNHTASEGGTVMVVDSDGNVNYDGIMEKIQGRGNGTWSTSNAKNPYNVKLAESTSLLGLGKGKKWVLLANNGDSSLVKNQLTYDFAKYIGINYQPTCKPIDVYINQQYYGSYQLSEKVEIKSSRIEINDAYENLEIANGAIDEATGIFVPADLSDAPATSVLTTSSQNVGQKKYSTNQAGSTSGGSTGGWGSIIGGWGGGSSSTGPALVNPTDITGGYLYELEISQRWVDEKAGFCAYNRQGWVMKSCDVATKEMVDYSYDLLFALGSAVYNNGTVPSAATTTTCSSGKTTVRTTNNPAPAAQYQGKKWSDILDADSAVKYYWTQEYFKNMDSSTSSTYFYKDSDTVDTKLYAGPMWDMDNSIGYNMSGSRWGHSWTSSDDWYTKNTRIYRFYNSDSTTSYSTDAYAPLSFYGALATKCTDFWSQASSYWYNLVEPAVDILLGEAEDPTGTLHSTEYYINTVSKSNTMDNLRLNLNNDNAWDYNSMITGMNNWFRARNTWIDSQIPKIDISNTTVQSIPSQACSGLEITPDVVVTYNGATLVEGVDYTLEYADNVAATTSAKAILTGKGLYTGTKTVTFTITSGSIVGGSVTIPDKAYKGDTIDATVKNANGDEIHQFLTYQWKADGVAIPGATGDTFQTDSSYAGKNITVEVKGDGKNIATIGVTSNSCEIIDMERPQGYSKTIATWNYDYTANPDALVTADETGETYYYLATDGENAATASLTSSVNATSESRIKWSGSADLYANDSTTITPDQTPVMGTSKTDGLAWGEYPYFETVVSTSRFEDIKFSAKLGGTKRAPREWKLQYSLDGETYTDVEGATYSIVANKTMEQAFDNVSLPSACDNQSKVYIRMVVCDDVAINGLNTILNVTSGDAAVNNIVITGATLDVITELAAPTIDTTSTSGDKTAIFNDENVVITDNNGGADVYYTINDGDPILYTEGFNPFEMADTKGTNVTVKAYAKFNDIESEITTLNIKYAGVNIESFSYSDYSQNVSNGAVFASGGIYGESGKMTAYTDGNSQYVPLWNASNGAYSIAPDDGALWSNESGFYFETSTAGYRNTTFTCKAYTTAQGPNSVALEYSLDGISWTAVGSNVQLEANGSLEQAFMTVALPSACDNQAKVYIRVITKENITHGSDLVEQTSLHNNASKGNLYINDVIIGGEDDGTYKMPYTDKTTNYFGSGAIEYVCPSGQNMQYNVTDENSNVVLSGSYPEGGIVISAIEGFNQLSAGPYTVSVWAGDDDDRSLTNVRQYYYKGDTITKFNYSETKKPLSSYISSDLKSATNTSGVEAGTLSMYPNGVDATTLSYTNTYGVKVSYAADNTFVATKNLDKPKNNGYWLIQTSTYGFTDVTLNLEQLSSNKGPRDWGLAYSTDGTNYTYVPASNVRAISNDSALSTVETYNNFKLPSACDNQDNLYIKVFINGGEAVNGKELELLDAGNTGINGIELSGIAVPVPVDVTIKTVALENPVDSTGTRAVSSKIVVDGTEYTATNGVVTVRMNSNVKSHIYASVNGSFVNSVSYTPTGNAVITVPVVDVDMNGDGIVNAKDYAMIIKSKDANKKAAFNNFINIKDDTFKYAK